MNKAEYLPSCLFEVPISDTGGFEKKEGYIWAICHHITILREPSKEKQWANNHGAQLLINDACYYLICNNMR